MLNQNERRRLNAIERQLPASDPGLAHLLTHWPTPARTRWAMAAAATTIAVGTFGILLGVLALAPLLIFRSAFMALAGWTWVYRHSHRIARPRTQ
jgi:DUF3040 family protein